MKKLTLLICAMTLSVSAFAQYEPTTTWPYIYSDFTRGTLLQPNLSKKEALFNVHLASSSLQFLDGNMIKELSASDVLSVQIGEDCFVCVGGKMMKVMARSDKGCVVQGVEVDIAKLNSTGAAYGSGSSTLGNMSLSSLEGIGGTRSNMNHMDLKSNKENGESLPLITKLYIMCDGQTTYATKRDVSAKVGADKMKAFLKENKIKWQNPQSLLAVVNLIAENN